MHNWIQVHMIGYERAHSLAQHSSIHAETTHNSHNWNHCGTKILTLNFNEAHIIIVFIQAWHVEQRSITAFLPLGAAACRGQSCGMVETWKPEWQWDDHLAVKFRTCIRPSFQHNSNFAELGKEVLKNRVSPLWHEIAKSWQVTPTTTNAEWCLWKHLQPGRCFSGKWQYFCRNSSACRSCAPGGVALRMTFCQCKVAESM